MIRITTNSPLVVIVDPHHGQACNGLHSILVHGHPLVPPRRDECGRLCHVALTWQATAYLSVRGSKEFHEAFTEALAIAEEMERRGGYFPRAAAAPKEEPTVSLGCVAE